MSLNLDQRQRAMLREMGVRVWQPLPPVAKLPDAIETIAVSTGAAGGNSRFDKDFQDKGMPVAPGDQRGAAPARPVSPPPLVTAAAPAAPAAVPAPAGSAQACWRIGPAQALYADSAQAGGARWLVLAQTPPAGLQAPAFEGDAGRLLDNLLRAARRIARHRSSQALALSCGQRGR